MTNHDQWYPAEPAESEDAVVEGGRVEQARWLAVRAALSLEIKGLKRSGRSARVLANEIIGQDHAKREAAYVALNAKIVQELGPTFNKPLT